MTQEALNHVLERWPEWRRRIEHLAATDERFREICQDYQELASWVSRNRSKNTERLENAIQLLETLAVELAGFLTKGKNSRPP